jgi:hypothetical protein
MNNPGTPFAAFRDPWLTARMADATTLARAEAALHPVLADIIASYLTLVARAVLGTTTAAAAAFQTGDDEEPEPDLGAFPHDTVFTTCITQRLVPAVARVFTAAFTTLTPDRAQAADHAAATYTATLTSRLASFPRRVYIRLRDALTAGHARRETTRELRARLAAALDPAQWNGYVLTATRTEAHTATQAAAYAAATDDQSRTGRTWTKTWQATLDDKVRDTHRAADGQTIPLLDAFTVGGHPLRFPGDLFAPPEETVNCRCSTRYTPTEAPQ